MVAGPPGRPRATRAASCRATAWRSQRWWGAHERGAPESKGPGSHGGRPTRAPGQPLPGPGKKGGRDRRRNPTGRLPAASRAPVRGPVRLGSTRARRPCPRPSPGLAGPPSRPYPRHDAQDGVRLSDQRVGVEGAPGFARSVRTPFHRACTRAVPPARRAPPARARARRPRPLPCSRGRRGLGLPRGGVVRGERGRAWAARVCARRGASAADPAEGELVASVVTSARLGVEGGACV